MKRMIVLAACALMVSGCFGPPEVQLPRFNAFDVEFANKKGTGVIEGDLFARTRGGDTKLGSGATIQICPYNGHVQEYWRSYANTANPLYQSPTYGYIGQDQLDYAAMSFVESTTADSQGRFRFEDLAPGRYIVHGKFEWRNKSGAYGRQVAVATTTVRVEDGKTARVSLHGTGVR